jgi:hypothetical protein
MEPRVAAREDSLQLTLRDVVAPLFRSWRLLLGTFLSVFALIAWSGFRYMHNYASVLTVSVRKARLHDGLGEAPRTLTQTPVSDEEVQSLSALFKNRDLLEKVVIANNLQAATGGLFAARQGDDLGRAVRTLARDLEITLPRKTGLIKVSYRSPDPALAYGVLNTLSNLYIARYSGSAPQGMQAPLEDAEVTDIFVAAPPVLPVLPMNSAASILLLASVLALVAACVAGYLVQCFDPFFHNQADVIDVLGIPVVEAIPKKTA